MAILLEVHVMILFVAVEGLIVAVSCSLLPSAKESEVLFRLMPVAGTLDALDQLVGEIL